jgi:Holliday junction resolvase
MSLRELASQAKQRVGKGRHGRLLTFKEIRRIKKRGYEAERELVRKLRVNGFKAVRVPVSAPSGEPLPDVFATKGDRLMAFEVKAPRAERAYFPRGQVEKLFFFLNFFEPYTQKKAVLAAKFPRKWVFKLVEKPDDYVVSRNEQGSFHLE